MLLFMLLLEVLEGVDAPEPRSGGCDIDAECLCLFLCLIGGEDVVELGEDVKDCLA